MNQYGTYALPGALQSYTNPIAARLRTVDSAGRNGAYSQGGLINAKRITMTFKVFCTSVADRVAKWQAICNSLPIGEFKNLIVDNESVYYVAEVEGYSCEIDVNKTWLLTYDVTFFVPSGVALSSSELSTAISTSATIITTAGNLPSLPRYEIAVSSIGSNGTIEIKNNTTAKSMVIKPTATGTIIIDSHNEIITRGGVDIMGEWQSGEFVALAVGANSIQINVTNSLTLGTSYCYSRNRFK